MNPPSPLSPECTGDQFGIEPALAARIEDALLVDRPTLRQRLSSLQQRELAGRPVDRLIDSINERLVRSEAAVVARRAARPSAVQFPQDLPITAHLPAITTALQQHPVVVVCGETGSGKTTQLAKLCLHLGRGLHGRIGHTQPRRIAARAVAARLAAELAAPKAVGYSVRFDDTVAHSAAIQVMTDGLLLAHTQSDPDLLAYDTLIIDEAHERSLNIDFLLGYLHRLLPRRPDLRLIITSATIEPQRFADHFGGAPVIEVSGRGHPVELRYRPLVTLDPDQADLTLAEGIVAAVGELQSDAPGDVLVFLPGEREIRDAAEAMRLHGMAGLELLPLYARLSRAEQDRVFAPSTRRRIVLATNVAETSLTVPGIRYVVDSGLARVSRYGARSRVQHLGIEKISRAAATQRAGRCGRLGPGVCIRLYADDDHANRTSYTDPEIHRASLASVVLRMQAVRLGDAADFPFMDPPQRRHLHAAQQVLFELGAVDSGGALTGIGRQLARFPLDPSLGRMLIEAGKTGALREVLIITAVLTLPDPRERPLDARQHADQVLRQFADAGSDFLTLLSIYRAFEQEARHRSQSKLRAWCREHFLSYLRLREWRDVTGQLTALANGMGLRASKLDADYGTIHRALLAGLLGRIAHRLDPTSRGGRVKSGRELAGTHGTTLRVFPGSVMARKPPRWLMAAELIDTGRLYARTVARIEVRWIEAAASHLVRREYSEPQWDPASRRPVAFERVTLFGLTLVSRRRVAYGPIDPAHARAIFIREAMMDGAPGADCPALEANRFLLEALETLQAKVRRPLLIDDEAQFALYDERLPANVWDGHRFEHWLRKQAPDALRLSADQLLLAQDGTEAITPQAYPDQLAAGGALLPLRYRFEPGQDDDGITVRVPRAILSRIDGDVFDWLIPGWLPEKCTALIRSLPGPLRRQFVPAPDFAAKALLRLNPGVGPLLPALAEALSDLTGQPCPGDAFSSERIEPYLCLRFEILDEHGASLAAGRDLPQLRGRFAGGPEPTLLAIPRHALEREGIIAWDFGVLPRQVTLPGPGGVELLRWPALVDAGDSCALRLFDDQAAATAAHRGGVRALLVRTLARELPTPDTLAAAAALYRRLGSPAELLHDLHRAIIDSVWDDLGTPRDRGEFASLAERLHARLIPTEGTLTRAVSEALRTWRDTERELGHATTLPLLDLAADLRDQLGHLIYAGFIVETPPSWLVELPRFLEAATLRLDRARRNPGADRGGRQALQPLWEAFWQEYVAHVAEPAWVELRWLLEELRVALFAPQLRTTQPISVARFRKLFQAVKAGR
ncbi:MAG: ATP-dependent RNA helicase HrpA [Immundisolibacter sp.]|uniref:ATP-dependent RNA helicase HrpA n=1 Tax=Immundisolibacter sp. TaxID=1934948 RepID=UPI003EE17EC3